MKKTNIKKYEYNKRLENNKKERKKTSTLII